VNILITNIKDYNLFCEEYESKGIIWKNGHKLTDRNAPIYERVIRNFSFGDSIIILIHPDNRCTRIEEIDNDYFNHIIKKGDYIEYSLVNAKIIVV